ncbi:hypothetical protein [Salisediminibacterium halotolerans]|uniref:Uncharacterized protein n=1 Tax=Salisediminibacterium halotolerans TaxID=517425 RepID=A0A1H9WFG7_9BACI|nr:hypothetical protein [Salisediminibacterium haloalkalitolerans]SES32529.1 hypothetical protein SAMN05444126_1347 [Salisediminibacterium haloalkalitolerans]
MVLTIKEKKLMLRLLKKERRKKFFAKNNVDDVEALIDKLEQNLRNENMNETAPDKL